MTCVQAGFLNKRILFSQIVEHWLNVQACAAKKHGIISQSKHLSTSIFRFDKKLKYTK